MGVVFQKRTGIFVIFTLVLPDGVSQRSILRPLVCRILESCKGVSFFVRWNNSSVDNCVSAILKLLALRNEIGGGNPFTLAFCNCLRKAINARLEFSWPIVLVSDLRLINSRRRRLGSSSSRCSGNSRWWGYNRRAATGASLTLGADLCVGMEVGIGAAMGAIVLAVSTALAIGVPPGTVVVSNSLLTTGTFI